MTKCFWEPTTLLAPVPAVIVSCGSMEHPNALTVAWTGIVNTKPAMTYISLQKSRYSYELIDQTGEFVINLVPQSMVKAADFCGVRSGRDMDKFAHCGFTPQQMTRVGAPGIEQSPINVECRVSKRIELGSHEMFLSDIVGVHVDEDLIDESGKLHIERADLTAYAHGAYYALSSRIGTFGYSVRKKSYTKKRK